MDRELLLREILRMGHICKVHAIGLSMFPTYKADCDFFIRASVPRKGDIVLASTENLGRRIHRVIRDYDSTYLLKGDGLAFCERELISSDKVIGIVVGYSNNGKDAYYSTNKTYYFFSSIISTVSDAFHRLNVKIRNKNNNFVFVCMHIVRWIYFCILKSTGFLIGVFCVSKK